MEKGMSEPRLTDFFVISLAFFKIFYYIIDRGFGFYSHVCGIGPQLSCKWAGGRFFLFFYYITIGGFEWKAFGE